MCKCKECGIESVRISHGRSGKSRAFLHTDAAGRRWNGFQCPDCRLAGNRKWYHKAKAKAAPRVDEEDELLGPADVLYPPKKRPCRTCNVMTVNHYACNSCQVRIMGRNPDAYFESYLQDSYGDCTSTGLGLIGRTGWSKGQQGG